MARAKTVSGVPPGEIREQRAPAVLVTAQYGGSRMVDISTSGGEPNIIMALEEARKQNMMSVALLGYGSGEISGKAWLISPLSRAATPFRASRKCKPRSIT